jgi:predicted RecB family endonuclease
MSDALTAPLEIQTNEPNERYFSVQIKAWTNFDPMDKSLAKVAEAIEQGGGFLTLVEVLKVEDDLACISDEEVRECFANMLAAKRLVRNVHDLPKKLIEDLRSALRTEEEVVPKKTAARVAISAANLESRIQRWP